ncbi:MAG: rhodanese-like domain-containing protein, partial [Myxococcota bacterium]|nr:rhodanese-like domain-containing protein [Myxococcota bacterium]
LEQDGVFWDTREQREFAGETPYRETRGGHLPGARHLWFKDLMTATGTLKNRGELRSLLTARSIPLDQPVIAYCTGGVRSGFAYAVLRELGAPTPANYDGSMWEWSADPERPLVAP